MPESPQRQAPARNRLSLAGPAGKRSPRTTSRRLHNGRAGQPENSSESHRTTSPSMKFPSKLLAALLLVLSASCANARPTAADDGRVFFVGDHYPPSIRLDRLPNQSEQLRAILAMYTLQNGAGCEGRDSNGRLRCSLTSELGLGANCSPEHFQLVRKWFTETPKLSSRWVPWEKDSRKEGALENLCYRQPDTASWQNIWTEIQVKMTGSRVVVSAIQHWASTNGSGTVRYKSEYDITNSQVKVVSSMGKTLCESTMPIGGLPEETSKLRRC